MAKSSGIYDPAYPADTVLTMGPEGPDSWVIVEPNDAIKARPFLDATTKEFEIDWDRVTQTGRE